MSGNQSCHAFGGCGKVMPPPNFYAGVPGLCCDCADQMAKEFEIPHKALTLACFAIECGIKAEKQAYAEAKLQGLDPAPRAKAMDEAMVVDGVRQAYSVRRAGQKSLLKQLIKLSTEAPKDWQAAQACYLRYEAWVFSKYGVKKSD